MNIILAAATTHEIAPIIQWLDEQYEPLEQGGFKLHEQIAVYPLITGVGMLPAGYALMRAIKQLQPDLIIQAGLGGALNDNFSPGEVLQITSEQIADLGAEDRDGSFLSVFDLDLADPDQPPFEHGIMKQEESDQYDFLPHARGITVNKVHGEDSSIRRLKKRVDADIESQEGAALFYTCMMEDTSFMELRAVSNYVEPRNRAGWEIESALTALNNTLEKMLPLFIPQ